MLPYTPLHYLLVGPSGYSETKQVLVMTSGNLSEEPIAFENQEALTRLQPLADAFLLHNRPIRTRCDDSVLRTSPLEGKTLYIRRARGYAPHPIHLDWVTPPLLATGTELKNTFCMTRGQYAFMSHHIGDMENFETLQSYEDGISHFERHFRIKPEILACDLHPDYLATRYAQERASRERLPLIEVQHHHAHIASCMVDNNLPTGRLVIGIAFDGTGYGLDNTIWGGEFLVAGYQNFRRMAHLQYMPLPGGDAAIKNPAKISLAYLWKADLEWLPDLPPVHSICPKERTILQQQLERQINTPQTSSLGRLFDAVAALIGLRSKVNYEAQAAIELEAIADQRETSHYSFEYQRDESDCINVCFDQLLKEISLDFLSVISLSTISARFQNAVVEMVNDVSLDMRKTTDINTVVLSGGVWQNLFLLNKVVDRLRYNGFHVLTHSQVPPNDGGVSLGQAVVAYHQLMGIK